MPSEIKSLTGLRGLAAVAVMAGHFSEKTPPSGLVGSFLGHTYYAVDLFFILSGFVLALVYGDEARQPITSKSFLRFLSHRIARIYPLYFLTTMLCFALVRSGITIYGDPTSRILALISNLFMTQSWGWPSDSLNGPGWSISTEWAANLLFPLFVVVILRRSWWVSAICAAVFVLAIAWSEDVSHLEFWGTPIIFQHHWLKIPQPLVACPLEFALGMYCWKLWKSAPCPQFLRHNILAGAIIAGLLVCMVTYVTDLCFILLSCLLVINLSYGTSLPARLLGTSAFYRLGLISFSIYLIHAPMISIVPSLANALTRIGAPHTWTLASLLVMISAVGLANLSYTYIELPSRRLLRRRFDASPLLSTENVSAAALSSRA